MRDRGRRCVVAEQRVRGVVGESSQMWDCACVGLLTKVRCGGGGVCGAVDEDVLLLGWRLGSRGGSIGEKGEMDRRVFEQVLGRRAAQEAQQVGQKSLVKRNFAV